MPDVLMLSPHCDDIPLSLGASLLAGQWDAAVHVSVIFSVSRYTLKDGWNNDVAAATAIRNEEERSAAARAGYTVEFLGFPEPGVRPGYTQITDIFNPDLPFDTDPIWEPLRERLLPILSQQTGLVVAPLGIGHHIDHRMVTACVREAAANGAAFAPVFYEDLPYAARFSSREIRRLAPEQLAGFGFRPERLTGGNLADKMQLLSIYRSQLSADDYASVADHWECRARAEMVWRQERPLGVTAGADSE
jgi:LmbE family N-acetylglucosaminyl deacetylase